MDAHQVAELDKPGHMHSGPSEIVTQSISRCFSLMRFRAIPGGEDNRGIVAVLKPTSRSTPSSFEIIKAKKGGNLYG